MLQFSLPSKQDADAVVIKKRQINFATISGYVLVALILPLLTAILAIALGMPTPRVHDEFSYLFMADTFALGRLANPEHPLAEFFQTFHILHHNGIYASKYFPGLGVQLLLGKILGHPMIGVWLTIGVFGASLLFFLRQFFSPRVALFISVLSSMQFLVLTYFGHSYWGGSLMALAGVWILGGAVLAAKHGAMRYSWLSAVGLVMGAVTRPFETLFYLVPLGCWILIGLWRGQRVSDWRWTWRLVVPLVAGGVFVLLSLGFYNQQITGNWKQFPHTLYEKVYSPYGVRFLWESKNTNADESFFETLPEPFHRVEEAYFVDQRNRVENFWQMKSQAASWPLSFQFPWTVSWLVIAAFAYKAHWKNWLWQLSFVTLLMRFGPLALSWSSSQPHYGAAWIFPVATLCAFGLQSMFEGKRTRILAGIAATTVLLGLVGTYFHRPNHHTEGDWKDCTSYDTEWVRRKLAVEKYLSAVGGQNVVLVQYNKNHSVHDEWVYNSPKIDAQKLIWAHDLGADENRRLLNYYSNRTIWRVDVDSREVRLEQWNQSEGKFQFIKAFRQ